jgi:hypothetical protein
LFQLGEIHRLTQKPVEVATIRCDAWVVVPLRRGGDDQQRRSVSQLAQATRDLAAIEARHPEIKQRDTRVKGGGHSKRLLAVIGRSDFVSPNFEEDTQAVGGITIVVSD